MTTTATQTVVRLNKNITEPKYTLSSTTHPSVPRLKTNLTEKKRQILSNISDALKTDIERKRAALAAHKSADARNPITASAKPPQQTPTSPSRPAFELAREPAYCAYRPRRHRPTSLYHNPSHGRPCTCTTPHLPLHPHQWRHTPAEVEEWNHALPNGGHAARTAKVKFSENPVTEVRVFECWYREEYEYGDGYWTKGPVGVTGDWSWVADDEWEVVCLDAVEEMGVGVEDGDREHEEDENEMMDEITLEEIEFNRVAGDADGGPLVRMA